MLCQRVKEKTVSLWSFVNDQRDIYLNPLYVHSVHQQHVLFPVASLRRIVPWTGYYLRCNPSIVPQVDCQLVTVIVTATTSVITRLLYWTALHCKAASSILMTASTVAFLFSLETLQGGVISARVVVAPLLSRDRLGQLQLSPGARKSAL